MAGEKKCYELCSIFEGTYEKWSVFKDGAKYRMQIPDGIEGTLCWNAIPQINAVIKVNVK